jgi:hypothetical protein
VSAIRFSPGNHELPLAFATCATALAAAGDGAIGPDAADSATHPMKAAIRRENSVFSEVRPRGFVIFALLNCTSRSERVELRQEPEYRTHEWRIPAAIFATVQATESAAGVPACATDTTVQPTTTAINSENSVFSEIRPRGFVIFALLVCCGGVRSPMEAM